MDDHAPEIQGYRVLERIGEGGIGVVYLAETTAAPPQRVAIKVLHAHTAFHESDVRRLLREARVGQRLHHAHILPVLEIARWGTAPALVMEYVEGVPLSRWKVAPSEGQAGLAEKLLVLASVADALEHAHAQGVIHRDVKPANIMVRQDGHPFLIDFGMARTLRVDSTITATGAVLGTPAYLPPEVLVAGGVLDFRSDLYSLGVSLYQVATGRLPFPGESLVELLRSIREDEPPSLRALAPHAPAGLEPIVARALEKRPRDRYPSAAALRDDLRRVAMGLRPKTGRASLWVNRELRRLRRARRRIATLTLTALLAILVALGFGYARLREDLQEQELLSLRTQGFDRLDRGELDAALSAFDDMAALEPEDGRAALARADAFAEFRMWERASQEVRAARALDPEREEEAPERAFHDALLAHSDGDRVRAREALELALAADPQLFRAYLLLELLERRALRPEAARAALEQCRRNLKEVDPRHVQVSALLAELDGRFGEAIAGLETLAAAANPPSFVPLHLGYAYLASYLGGTHDRQDLTRARAALEHATELEPEDGQAWSNLAITDFLLDEHEEAERNAARALACDPRLEGANRVLAVLDARAENWERCLARLEAVEPGSPAKEQLHRFQADVLYREGLQAYDSGEHARAASKLESCVDLNPNHLAGWFALASSRSGLHEDELALGAYRRALALLPEGDPAPTASWSEQWQRESALIRSRHAADIRVGCLGSAASLTRELEPDERRDCQASLEDLEQVVGRGERLPDVTALNLAEALVSMRDAELTDIDLACDLVRRQGLRAVFRGNPQAGEILARIDLRCPP